ncbi:aromatic-L-amino-acid decarboxylase-like isoform X2 [Brevipalpus obovatus]|uniref:aromatic-L-amino-acid decarboxylase-like isoform X2 n=1 Tax=Brevipalpus obovatus TaxID=246614 RepID=UPI003D9F7A5D
MDAENSMSIMEIEPRSDYLGEIYGMEPHEFVQAGKGLMEYIVKFISSLRSQPAVAKVAFGYLRPMIPEKSPNKPEDWDKIMDDFDRLISPGVQSFLHPRFVSYFPLGSSFPSILGEALIASLGTLAFSVEAAPAATELENICLDWMAKATGLPDFFLFKSKKGGGCMQPSASDVMMVIMLSARHNAIQKYKKKNPQMSETDILGKLVMYSSEETHSCVRKGAKLCLINHRVLPTDDRFRFRGATLEKAIKADKEKGLYPFLAFATIGTTSTASVDAIDELGKVCKREDLYFHVDGAYGGCFMICPEYRHFLKGIEYVDSYNFNPNKNLLVAPDSSLMVRNKKNHTSAFMIDAAYLNDEDTEDSAQYYDYRNWGIALSRRFRALKLWFVMRKYGVSGLQEHIRRNVAVARVFEELIRKDDRFEIFNDVNMSLVCIRLKGSDPLNEKLFEMVRETHAVFLSQTMVKNQFVIRVSVDSPHATGADMKDIYKIISKQASELLDDLKLKGKIGTISIQKQGESSGNPDGTSQIDKIEAPKPSGSGNLARELPGKTSRPDSYGEHLPTGDLGHLISPFN